VYSSALSAEGILEGEICKNINFKIIEVFPSKQKWKILKT